MGAVLYGIGIGPGDYELITLKALRIINENNVIAFPKTGGEKNAAFDTVSKVADLRGKEVLELSFPMIRDKEQLNKNYQKNCDIIEKYLKNGQNVVFISIGDISVYSTFGYINDIIKNRGYETIMIPGVTSFCAAASALGISLTSKSEPVHIIPAVYGGIDEYMSQRGTKIFMKSGALVEDIKKAARENGVIEKSYLAGNCGFDDEKLCSLEEADGKMGYFTTIIVKDN